MSTITIVVFTKTQFFSGYTAQISTERLGDARTNKQNTTTNHLPSPPFLPSKPRGLSETHTGIGSNFKNGLKRSCKVLIAWEWGKNSTEKPSPAPTKKQKKACFFWSTARQRNKTSQVYWLGRLSMWEPVWGISTTNLKSYLLGAHLSDDGQGAGCTATAVPTSWLKHCLAMKQPVRDGFTLKQANKKRTGVLRTDLGTPCRARSA